MTDFQKQCHEALQAVFDAYDIAPNFETFPDSTLVVEDNQTYLRAELTHSGRYYDVYIYADEAGADIGGNWYIFETQDFPEPNSLIASFAAFMERCLAGGNPATVRREL